jgi:hemin uptake protein HemP
MQICQDLSRQRPPTPGDGIPRAIDQPSSQVKSIDLLQGRRAVDIEHNGALYRLQTTKLGKLILTK